jgi:hypothetical protein
VVGTYTDANGVNHGFVDSGGVYTTFDGVPGAPMNLIQGINNSEQIVGFAVTDNIGTTEGFVSSVPEPASLLLAGLGLIAVVIRKRVSGS